MKRKIYRIVAIFGLTSTSFAFSPIAQAASTATCGTDPETGAPYTLSLVSPSPVAEQEMTVAVQPRLPEGTTFLWSGGFNPVNNQQTYMPLLGDVGNRIGVQVYIPAEEGGDGYC